MKNCIEHSVNPLLCGEMGILSEGYVLRLRNESPKLHHARVHVELLKGLNDSKMAHNGRDFSRFNGLNPLIKEVPKGIPTDKIPTDKRKPEGISFIG